MEEKMVVEFVEWIRENYYDIGDCWCEWNNDSNTYSSEELVFKFKNKKNE